MFFDWFLKILVFALIFLPFQVQAHFVGYVHHELVFRLEKNRLVSTYNLNLSSTEFQKLQTKVDKNSDFLISENEAKDWLDTWKNDFTVEINSKVLVPQKAINFISLEKIQNNLFPVLKFEIDFGEVEIDQNWSDFKVKHTYRISEDQREYYFIWTIEKSLVINTENIKIPDSFEISGQWKKVSQTQETSVKPTETQYFSSTKRSSNPFFAYLTQTTSYLSSLLKEEVLTINSILVILLLGFFVGSLHSLSPGHGKTIMASYMILVKGKLKDALWLAISITISHTLVVVFLAFLFIFLNSGLNFQIFGFDIFLVFDLKSILPYFSIISGLVLIIIGLYILTKKIPSLKTFRFKKNTIQKNNLRNSFSFNPDFQIIQHGTHIHKIPNRRINFRESVALGVSTGLIPCIDAVAILILALNINLLWLGIIVTLSFSLGMASALTLIGYSVTRGMRFKNRFTFLKRFNAMLAILSPIFIIFLGVLSIFANF